MVALGSLSISTRKTYTSSVNQYRRWALQRNFEDVFPFFPEVVAEFLLDYAKRPSISSSSINTMLFALKWAHNLLGLVSPTDSFLVQNVLKSLKRSLAKPVCKKPAGSVEMLKAVVDTMRHDGSLVTHRLTTMLVLATHAMFRISELLQVRREHITFYENYFKIFVPKAKNDQVRAGNYSYFKKARNPVYCPQRLLCSYLSRTEITGQNVSFSEML